jgi:release factor glutamine methyltransferase
MLMKEAYYILQSDLSALYDNREAANIADWVMEEVTKLTKSQRIIHHNQPLTDEQVEVLHHFKNELQQGRPIQYVLGYSWFRGLQLKVNEHVLIPRPETEELVEAIKKYYIENKHVGDIKLKAIDIGTGSGCIAIALQHEFADWEVWALDTSASALSIAAENAKQLNQEIHFKQADILTDLKIDHLPVFDVIVSNPPYIPIENKEEMTNQVLNHEPHLALFISNKDPLQFYKAIVKFSEFHLRRGGTLWFETHTDYANNVATLLRENDYENVLVLKDFQGKDRIVTAKRTGDSL